MSGETIDKCVCPLAVLTRNVALAASGSTIDVELDTLWSSFKSFVEAGQKVKETKEQEESAKKGRREGGAASSDVTMGNDETQLPKVRRVPSDGEFLTPRGKRPSWGSS